MPRIMGKDGDHEYMALALRLAELGKSFVSPNPLVGAVVVKDGRIVGAGFHRAPGKPHAEAMALEDAGKHATGATLYVNLEPCCHIGRTPPCVDRIMESRISRVVVSILDPNPLMNGRSVERLRRAGIQVDLGLMSEEAESLNEKYLKKVRTGLPFVSLKLALTLDGFVADRTGASQWISGEAAREEVHRLRGEFDGIVIGLGTVVADNPRLTPRSVYAPKNPTRFVIDTRLACPETLDVFKAEARTVLVCTPAAAREKERAFQDMGIEIWKVKPSDRGVQLLDFLKVAGEHGYQSLLFEGGAKIGSSLIEEGLLDRLYLILAPKVLGNGRTVFEGMHPRELAEAYGFQLEETRRLGEDVLLVYRPAKQ
jgi:diaminohydroxyphosphoribosylaminopyrimidine deaminase/5-amino-6-(5-phosphoribosylamino)uracil reductase